MTPAKSRCDAVSAIWLGALLAAGVAAPAVADPPGEERLARPPQWSADVLGTFFPDARDRLAGERPDYGQPEAQTIAALGDPVAPADNTSDGRSPAWSKLVDADTVETEILRLARAVAADVTTPSDFKGGKFRVCRQHFSLLAVLFAVAGQYDGSVRWQDVADPMCGVFARAAQNARVGTDQTYREAVERKQDLEELIRGSRPRVSNGERPDDWGRIADRPPLMQRLNVAHQDRLMKWLVNEREFARYADDVRHEAQLVALLADVITREGYEFWDDHTYAEYARALRQAASDVAAATEAGDFEQARAALDRATMACADCHDGYRG